MCWEESSRTVMNIEAVWEADEVVTIIRSQWRMKSYLLRRSAPTTHTKKGEENRPHFSHCTAHMPAMLHGHTSFSSSCHLLPLPHHLQERSHCLP